MKPHKQLKKIRACKPARQWVKRQHRNGLTWQQMWDSCDRGDWMIWLVFRLSGDDPESEARKVACLPLADIVESFGSNLACIRDVIDCLRRRAVGKATIGELRKAGRTAYAAYAAYSTASSAYAASAAYAAYSAYASDAANAAADAANNDIVRKYYPTAPDISEIEEPTS